MKFNKLIIILFSFVFMTSTVQAENALFPNNPEGDHLYQQISEECRNSMTSTFNYVKAGCQSYRTLLTELKIGDQIQTKIDNVFHEPRWNDTSRGEFKLFNGFHSAYDLKEKSFMSKLRPNDDVILTKIFPRHSVCNLKAEIQHGLVIWNMKVPSRNVQSNFEFTYTGTKKFCGGSSSNYNGTIERDSPESQTRWMLLKMQYD